MLSKDVSYTHKAILTVVSNADEPDVHVRIDWEPDLEGTNIQELGYLPAAYQMIESYILPALEEAYLESVDMGMSKEPPSRSIN